MIKTGLCDSTGREICIGDKVKIECDMNKELHGEYSIYRIEQKGIIPFLIYEKSQNGQIAPDGYMGCLLTDYYDSKLLFTVCDISRLTPTGHIVVQ